MMMRPAYGFEIRERSGSDEQLRPLAETVPRRIKLPDGCSLRAWP